MRPRLLSEPEEALLDVQGQRLHADGEDHRGAENLAGLHEQAGVQHEQARVARIELEPRVPEIRIPHRETVDLRGGEPLAPLALERRERLGDVASQRGHARRLLGGQVGVDAEDVVYLLAPLGADILERVAERLHRRRFDGRRLRRRDRRAAGLRHGGEQGEQKRAAGSGDAGLHGWAPGGGTTVRHGSNAASCMPWMIFLSGGQNVASAPPRRTLPPTTK